MRRPIGTLASGQGNFTKYILVVIQIRWQLFLSHPKGNKIITTKFCRWYERLVVVVCVKIYHDITVRNGITAKRNFLEVWIVVEKTLVKRAPDLTSAGIQRKLGQTEPDSRTFDPVTTKLLNLFQSDTRLERWGQYFILVPKQLVHP